MRGSALDRFDAVQLAYRRTRDALKIACRVLHADPVVRCQTHLVDVSGDELDDEFNAMEDRLDQATVVNLWVIFERFVIDRVIVSLALEAHGHEKFASRVRAKTVEEIERWRFDELLGLYKGVVDSNALGSAKQVKSYRDWVAHRNPRKPPPAFIEPEQAYRSLVSIVRRVEAGEPGADATGS